MQAAVKLGTLCYIKSQGRTLMLHRTKKSNDMHEGKWVGLGGKLEVGESPEECVIREVYEESGLCIENPILQGVLTFPGFHDDVTWYGFLFVATVFSGTLVDSAEGELAWIEDRQLLRLPMHEGDRLFLEWLNQDRFFSAKFVYVEGELTDYDVVFYTADGEMRAGAMVDALRETSGHGARGVGVGKQAFRPMYVPEDDQYCWMCGGAVVKRHCKITCQTCGFMRDCSDP